MPNQTNATQRGAMTMNKIGRKSMFRRIVMVVCATLAMTTVSGPARADHVEEGLGILIGGIVGGSIGSRIGKGNGRRIAIGVGSALGALYGGEVASHHRPSRRNAHYTHPGHSPAPAVVRYYHYPQPVPVYVQPAPVYVTPPQATEKSINVSIGSGSVNTRYRQASITECRLLEDGLAPVYGCRDAHGDWRILR